jgi:hypothetical protein
MFFCDFVTPAATLRHRAVEAAYPAIYRNRVQALETGNVAPDFGAHALAPLVRFCLTFDPVGFNHRAQNPHMRSGVQWQAACTYRGFIRAAYFRSRSARTMRQRG